MRQECTTCSWGAVSEAARSLAPVRLGRLRHADRTCKLLDSIQPFAHQDAMDRFLFGRQPMARPIQDSKRSPLPRKQTVQRLTTQTLTSNDDAGGAWLLVYW